MAFMAMDRALAMDMGIIMDRLQVRKKQEKKQRKCPRIDDFVKYSVSDTFILM
jgi:hypothetical protein